MLVSMSVDNFERLRDYVIQRRAELGISQAEVARRGGFPAATLAMLEAATRQSIPRQQTLQKIAKGLSVPYDRLDRIVRGMAPDPDAVEALTMRLAEELSPEAQRLLAEWVSLPPHERRAVELALSGLLQGLRRQPETP